VVSSMSPGDISRPVELEGAIAVYMLRDVERVAPGRPADIALDYALYRVDGGRVVAEQVAHSIDTCDDLFGVAAGQPEDRLIRDEQQVRQIPADIRAELEQLDAFETSTAITRGGQATVLMLCERMPALESDVDFTIVGRELLNQRLTAIADDHLSNLRAGTEVIDLRR